ncbi:MAG TPA: tetratricopeptide repeat protein, partial [Terriglobales bacterium]|nr:tetratricopeptide repeat protein [Terriglobales bacterium]
QRIDISGKITDLGKLDATVSYTMRGDSELLLRMLFRRVPAARWNDLVKVLAQADGFNPDSASNLKADSPEDTGHPFHLSYTISQPNYLDWSSKKARLDVPIPHMRLVTPDQDEDSNDPVKLGPISLITATLHLELPAKYTAQAPLPVEMQKDFGLYKATYKLEGNVLTAERTLKTNVTEFPSARVPEFLSFRRIMASDEGQQVGLESTVASGGGQLQGMKADDLHEAGIDALRSNNFKLAAELFEQVVKQEPKHKFAWNNLGRAYMGLGQYDKAAGAIRKQIEVNPYDEFAYNNLGRVLWLQLKYDDAAAAFRKQIELNPLDKFAHSNLGALLIDQKKYADAVPELEKAVNLTPDDPLLVTNLGRAYLNNNQTDKALQAFDRAVELAPAPPVWNNIAYELSLKKVSLDRAQRYAESAVTATAAALRNLSLDRVTLQDMGQVASIQSYWDTLGWVYYQQGEVQKAEKYVRAAWLLGGHGEVGDHLGQIYEKLGDKQKAIDTYTEALAVPNKVDATRARLAALVGDAKVDGMVKQVAATPSKSGTLSVTSPKKISGSADFFVLLVPGPKVEDVKWIGGSDELKGMSEALRGSSYDDVFPDGGDAKLIRRGTLTCTPVENPVATKSKGKVVAAAEKTQVAAGGSTCKFVLVNPEDVRSVE